MNTWRLCTLVSVLLGLSVGRPAPAKGQAAPPATTADHVVTGELVVTDAARKQFRLVRHDGSFTAPAGTAMAALSGKPVKVDIGYDGSVLLISPMEIHIEPITHKLEVFTGEFVPRDPSIRTFAIAGDDRTYIAPSGVDVGSYAGRLVEMGVDEQGRVIKIDLIARAADDAPLRSPSKCLVGDASVTSGLSICRRGTTFRCTDGEWVKTGLACD